MQQFSGLMGGNEAGNSLGQMLDKMSQLRDVVQKVRSRHYTR